jgi:hypothetical protein
MTKVRKPIPKTQKELSNEQVIPTYPQYGDPNDFIQTPQNNRALNTSFKGDTTKPFSVGIQDIDEAIYYYFQNVVQPSVTQNGARLNVPIIYGSPEKWKSFQKDGYYRDQKGKIMAPLIMFKKTDITKNRQIANKLDANYPNNFGVFTKEYTQRNAYDNFKVLSNRKPQKQYYAVVMPDYLTVTYECAVFTYYVEQLNKIVESMEYASDAYWGDPQRYQFKASIDSFGFQTELAQEDERIVRSTFTLKINGYIIPEILQKDVTALKKFSNITKTTFTLEDEPTTPITEAPLPPIPFTCAPVTVLNSGSTYTSSVDSGGILILPNQTININSTGSGLIPSVGDIGINLTDSVNPITPTSVNVTGRNVNIIISSSAVSYNLNLVDRFGNDLGTKPVTANANWDLRTLTPYDMADIFLTQMDTTPTAQEISYLNYIVDQYFAAGLWNKMYLIRPYLGSSANNNALNLRYPFKNRSSQFATFVGSPIHNSNGITHSGNSYELSYLDGSVLLDLNWHMNLYSRTDTNPNNAGATDMGFSNDLSYASFEIKSTATRSLSKGQNANSGVINPPPSSDGSFTLNCLSGANNTKFIKNGNILITSFTSTSIPTGNPRALCIGCPPEDNLINYIGRAARATNRNFAMATVGEGLSDAEILNKYTIDQAAQTIMLRQV